MIKSVVLWDRQIPATINRQPVRLMRSGASGVYIWSLNQHSKNSVIYIGQSGNVHERLYEEYRVQSGFISKWIDDKMSEKPIYCHRYSDPIIYGPLLKKGRCDCLPRLRVKIFFCEEPEKSELEKYLIRRLHPPLNKLLYAGQS